MNIEICKNCKYKSNAYNFILFPEYGKIILKSRINQYCKVIYNNYDIWKQLNTWRNQYHNNTILYLIEDKTAEPDKSCPYYMEHMIEIFNK